MAMYKGTKRFELLTALSNSSVPLADAELATLLGWERKVTTDCRFHMFSNGYVSKGSVKDDGTATWTISVDGLRALRNALDASANPRVVSPVVSRGRKRGRKLGMMRRRASSPSVARKKAQMLKVFLEATRPLTDQELVDYSGLPKHEVLRYRLNLVNEGLVVRFGYRPGRDRTRKPLHLWCHADRKDEFANCMAAPSQNCALSLDDNAAKATLIDGILDLSCTLSKVKNLARMVVTLGDLRTTQESLATLIRNIGDFQSNVTLDVLEQMALHSSPAVEGDVQQS